MQNDVCVGEEFCYGKTPVGIVDFRISRKDTFANNADLF